VSTPADLDQALRRWLRTHHSIIARYEAFNLGAGPNDVRIRLRRGDWVLFCPGVYQDASAPRTAYQPLRAGFVSLRGRGVGSHRAAAWLWGLRGAPPDRPAFTVAEQANNRVAGPWAVHRSRDFDLIQPATRQTILVTNPLRTLVDLAAVAKPAELTDAVDIAVGTRLVTPGGLSAEIDRLARPGRPGIAALRAHLAERGFIGAPPPSVLEAKTRRLVVGTRLPLPAVELRVDIHGAYRLDIAWAAILFAVEVDGYAYHFSPEHARNDKSRRNHLRAGGWYLDEYTWIDIVREPGRVAREITERYHELSRLAGTGAGESSPLRSTRRPGPGIPAAAPAPASRSAASPHRSAH
jgi:very-short-patch-repair endonuclease